MTDPKVFGFYFGLLCCHHILPSMFGCCPVFYSLPCAISSTQFMLCLVRATVATADWKVYTTLSPWVPLSPQRQLNVQWDALALTIKWNGDTDAVKILLYVFIFLCGVVLDGETMNSATQLSSGRGPSWTQVQSSVCSAFGPFSLLPSGGCQGTLTLKDSRRAGDLVWLLENKFSGLPWPHQAPQSLSL